MTVIQFLDPDTGNTPPRIGVSSCLLGEKVRYDGGHKAQPHILELAAECEFIGFCPEFAAGLGVPRPPVELVAGDSGVRALGLDFPHGDVTELLTKTADTQCLALQRQRIAGYLLKARSPSCGPGDVPVRTDLAISHGMGLFADRLVNAFPDIPVTSEALLDTPARARWFIGICQLTAEFQRWPGAGLPRWHRHYCRELDLPPSIVGPLDRFATGNPHKRGYWPILLGYLLQQIKAAC